SAQQTKQGPTAARNGDWANVAQASNAVRARTFRFTYVRPLTCRLPRALGGEIPIDPDLRQRIVESVREGFAEQIDFTKALVRFPSVRGAEHAIQDFVFRSYRDYG